MNIGLEHLKNTKPARKRMIRIPSNADIFTQYCAMEDFNRSSEVMFDLGKKLQIAFENVVSIGVVAKKYNSTEALAVLNALTVDDFHGRLSLEGLKDTATDIWKKIKAFFIRIKDWLVGFGKKVVNFVKSTLLKIAAKAVELRKAKDPKDFKPFKYTGLDLDNYASTAAILDQISKVIVKVEGQADTTTAATHEQKLDALDKLMVEHEVKTFEQANKVFENAKKLGEAAIALGKAAGEEYDSTTKEAREAEKNNNIEAAKNLRTGMTQSLKVYSKVVNKILRTLASVAIHRGIKTEENAGNAGAANA